MTCCCPEDLDDGQPGGSSSSPAGAPGWELVRRVRFSQVATIDPLPAGAVVIDGVTFQSVNVAAATVWRVLNGSGLQFTAAASSTQWVIAGGGQSATALRVAWRDLVPDYDPLRRYIVQAIVSANNANAASERVVVGAIRETNVPTGAARAIAAAFSGHNGVAAMSGLLAANSAGTGSVDYAWAAPAVLTWSASPSSPSGSVAHWAAAIAGDYPPMSDLRTLPWSQDNGTPSAITAEAYTDPFCEIAIAFPTGNASGTLVATVSDLRVLVAA